MPTRRPGIATWNTGTRGFLIDQDKLPHHPVPLDHHIGAKPLFTAEPVLCRTGNTSTSGWRRPRAPPKQVFSFCVEGSIASSVSPTQAVAGAYLSGQCAHGNN